MYKFLLLLIFATAAPYAYGQTDSLSKEDKRLLDSMFNNDEFIKLMTGKKKNYLDVSIGIGNAEFSAHNNAANATGVNRQMVYTPALNYRLKSGFNFGITGFITGDSSARPELYQTGLNIGYNYYSKIIKAGVSYTRYVSNRNKYNSKSLYQNDFYGYIKRAKGIIQPGLALGFANGKYKETGYVSYRLPVHLPNPPPNGRDTIIVISGKDSTNNRTSYFSLSGNIQHDFAFYKIFSKNDELDFTPSLILNFGSDRLTQTHTNKIFDRAAFSSRKKSSFSNKFRVQSIAASFNFTYMIRKFFLQPNLYVDYYLPETTAQRLGLVFSVTAGVSF